MGFRVAIEAALQAPRQTAGLILVDGMQFAAAMEPILMERFASLDGYTTITNALFNDMFTARSDRRGTVRGRAGVASAWPIGKKCSAICCVMM